ADQPVQVSGTWNLCGHIMWDTLHQAGRNFTVNIYQNQSFFGPMVGTLYITPDNPEFDVAHLARDGVTLTRVNFHGSGTFAGSVWRKNRERGCGEDLGGPNRSRRLRTSKLDVGCPSCRYSRQRNVRRYPPRPNPGGGRRPQRHWPLPRADPVAPVTQAPNRR